jgi:uncharacterized protein YcbX
VLSAMFLYPVKSCGAQSVSRWPVADHGLLYDREWCVVDMKGVALTQKTEPRLALVRARVTLAPSRFSSTVVTGTSVARAGASVTRAGTSDAAADDADELVLSTESDGSVTLSLPVAPVLGSRGGSVRDVTVCGQRCRAVAAGMQPSTAHAESVDAWLSGVLWRPVTLVRRQSDGAGAAAAAVSAKSSRRGDGSDGGDSGGGTEGGRRGFANDGDFLCVSMASVSQLERDMLQRYSLTGAQGASWLCV